MAVEREMAVRKIAARIAVERVAAARRCRELKNAGSKVKERGKSWRQRRHCLRKRRPAGHRIRHTCSDAYMPECINVLVHNLTKWDICTFTTSLGSMHMHDSVSRSVYEEKRREDACASMRWRRLGYGLLPYSRVPVSNT